MIGVEALLDVDAGARGPLLDSDVKFSPCICTWWFTYMCIRGRTYEYMYIYIYIYMQEPEVHF